MKKGQISIDLLLTAIVALMVVLAISGLVNNFKSTQEKINAQTQLDEINQKTASFITASQAINDTNFEITYRLRKINYADGNGNAKSTYPEMQIVDNNTLKATIQLSTPYGEQTITSNRIIYAAPIATVSITQAKTTGVIVIRHG